MRLRLYAALFAVALPACSQTLHLIPIPREVKPANALALATGLRISCQSPCDAQDVFAIADLKAALAARNIPTTDNPKAPHLFLARFATPLATRLTRNRFPPALPR